MRVQRREHQVQPDHTDVLEAGKATMRAQAASAISKLMDEYRGDEGHDGYMALSKALNAIWDIPTE